MRMHIGGEWIDKSEKIEVLHPFDGSVVDTIPKGDLNDVEKAIDTAERGAKIIVCEDPIEESSLADLAIKE